ncbi:MAG: energy-coupling factor ABC transporter permease [Bryobacteraceae bacterium]
MGVGVHIYDGFLSTPVWAAMDVAAVPAVGYMVRRAQRQFDESRIPLLGVMGAFVFAAQMINFPVGIGTSGHLVGGALLACTLGPAAAGVVLCAIIAIQALVFQDGGILALGPNLINMAILGVLAGYLPYYLWGGTPWRKFAIFAGGALSVMVSAILALAELLISGVPMSHSVVGVSLALFLVSALLEGAITLAVVQALEAIQPGFVRQPAAGRSFARGALGLAAVVLAAVGFLFASTAPDGIESLGHATGMDHVRRLFTTPLAGYQLALYGDPWLRKTAAGLAGIAIVYGACLLIGRGVARRGRA